MWRESREFRIESPDITDEITAFAGLSSAGGRYWEMRKSFLWSWVRFFGNHPPSPRLWRSRRKKRNLRKGCQNDETNFWPRKEWKMRKSPTDGTIWGTMNRHEFILVWYSFLMSLVRSALYEIVWSENVVWFGLFVSGFFRSLVFDGVGHWTGWGIWWDSQRVKHSTRTSSTHLDRASCTTLVKTGYFWGVLVDLGVFVHKSYHIWFGTMDLTVLMSIPGLWDFFDHLPRESGEFFPDTWNYFNHAPLREASSCAKATAWQVRGQVEWVELRKHLPTQITPIDTDKSRSWITYSFWCAAILARNDDLGWCGQDMPTLPYLRREIARMAMSAGVIPEMREAWPMVAGRMVVRWWRASALSPETLS